MAAELSHAAREVTVDPRDASHPGQNSLRPDLLVCRGVGGFDEFCRMIGFEEVWAFEEKWQRELNK